MIIATIITLCGMNEIKCQLHFSKKRINSILDFQTIGYSNRVAW